MNARALAIRVLERVEASDAFLNAVLDSQLRRAPQIDSRDAALVTELCYGAMRRQTALDYAIEQFSAKSPKRLDVRVRCALRVGAYQLFCMRLPKHAAVAETVEALKQLRMARAAGFANAVLRKLSQLDQVPLPATSDLTLHLTVRESHPAWLVSRWLRQFGRERTEAMLAADNRPAPLVIRANSSQIQRDALLKELRAVGVEAAATAVSPAGIALVGPGRVEDLYGYAEGLWQVQDEAAQLIGLYAAVPEGSRVLDACAAPGGKACHLAERVRVVANDIHQGKLRKLEIEARRLRLQGRIELHAHDAARPFPPGLGVFDAVLVDAPCSGLGTLRRHPELRYRRREADIDRLANLQRSILDNCAVVVAAGGLLIYAVCSTEPEESELQVEAFLRAHSEFVLESRAAPTNLPLENGYLRTTPGEEGWDGFFGARLRRVR